MQSFQEHWTNKRLRNWLIFAIIITAIILLAYYRGGEGYRLAKKYLNLIEKDKMEQVEKIKDSILIEKANLEKELDSIKQIETVIIRDYYNEFLREKRKNDNLQKAIDKLRTDVYTRHQLDSIAKHVKY